MHALLELLRNPIDRAGLYLFHASWQAAAAGSLVLALVLVGKRWSAPLRYGLLMVALLKFVVPPFLAAPSGVFTHWGPAVASSGNTPVSDPTDDRNVLAPTKTTDPTDLRDRIAGSSRAGSRSPGDLVRLPEVHVRKEPRDVDPKSSAIAENPTPIASRIPTSPDSLRPSAVSSVLVDGRFVVLLAWLIGAGLAAAWLLGQQRRLSRILCRAQPIIDASVTRRFNEMASALRMKRSPRLLRSDAATVPFACGLVTRTVVVPGELIDHLPAAQLDVVLAHELAHHRRLDLWVNAVQTLAFVAFWFHPVYWWLTRTIRQVREQCCDDLLLAKRLTSADMCCETLLAVARRPASPRIVPVAISMAHPLASRLNRLFDESQKRTSRLSVGGWILTAAAALLIWPGLRLATQTALLADDGRGAAVQPVPVKPVEVSGTLTDEGGAPIPGADVYLFRRNPFSRHLEDQAILLGQGQTDRTGHFRVTVASDELDGPLRWGTEIWAYKDGFAVVTAKQSAMKARSPVKLTSRRPTADLVVVGPDGLPVPDALVSPGFVQCERGSGDVPMPLRARLSRKTDAAGRVTLPLESRGDFHSVRVECLRFGVQSATFADRQRRFVKAPEKVSLGEVGTVVGQLKSDDPTAVADIEVRCVTSEPQGERAVYQFGSVTTRTNSKGEFRIPILRVGILQIDVSENQRFSRLAVPPRDLMVAAGRTTTVEVPLRKAVRVTGRAFERQTSQPVSGVVVAWPRDNREIGTATDAQGQYTFLAHSGQMTLRFFPPQPYVPDPEFQQVTIGNADSDQLAPLVLAKGRTLRGRTVDATGQPVDEVEVEVSWAPNESANRAFGGQDSRIARSGFSGDDGSFTIPAIPTDRELEIAARTKGVEVAEPVRLTPRRDQPFQMIVRRLDLIDLSGTVLDARQHPLPGAAVQIEQECNAGPNEVTMCVVDKATTDAHGQFRSTKKFDRQGLYRAQILVGGRKVAESEWITPAKQPGNQFPALRASAITVASSVRSPRESIESRPQNDGSKLLSTSTLAGTVIDSKNRPVANASVIVWSMAQRRRQQTSADGRFTWPDIPTDGAFLFVEAKDFRFHGQWIVPTKSATQIRLVRQSEPAASLHALADPPISKELRERSWRAFQPTLQQLLKELAEPGTVVEKIWNTGTFDDFKLLELYAEFDRPAALRFIDGHHFKYTWLPDFIRSHVAERLAASAPAESLRVIDQIKDAHARLGALCRAATAAPKSDASLCGQLLARARNELANVAQRWQLESLLLLAQTNRETGDAAAAAEFLKQAENRLQHPGSDENGDRRNFARGLIAIEKAMASGTDTTGLLGPATGDSDFNRYRGAIAEAIAARNPAAAEHILRTLREPENWTARICYAMAKTDFERAAHLARSAAEPVDRAYALGLVALVTAPKERETALRQLAEAYSILQQVADARAASAIVRTPVGTALGMLEIVEQIDPTLVREYLWRAVSLRNNTTCGGSSMLLGPYGPEHRMRLSDPVLAACLARYDDEAALHALRPPGDESVADGVERYPYWYFFSSAILDPAGTIDVVSRLPRDTPTQRIAAETAWRELFASLTHRGEARWGLIREKQMYLWKPGHNDF